MPVYHPESYEEILRISKANPTKLVVIDFHAVWCGPCKQIKPAIEDLSTKMVNVVFMAVDVDDDVHSETVNRLEITAMPTFIYMKNGIIKAKTTGANLKQVTDTIALTASA